MSGRAVIISIMGIVAGTYILVLFFLIFLCYWCNNDTEESEDNGEAIEMRPIGRDVGIDPESNEESARGRHGNHFTSPQL